MLSSLRPPPIQRVPPELLLRVFDFYIESHRNELERHNDSCNDSMCTYSDSINPGKGAWVLSHICHRWRELALSTGGFWSDIHCIYRPSDSMTASTDEFPRYVKSILLLITRSQQHPLSMRLISRDWPSSGPALRSLIDAFVQNTHRLKTLEILDVRGDFMKDLLPSSPGLSLEFPILRHLVVNVPWAHFFAPEESRMRQVPIFSKNKCPSIRTVKCRDQTPGLSALLWEKLEELDLQILCGCFDVLFPRLEDLRSLKIEDSHVLQLRRPQSAILLPSLQTLEIPDSTLFNWITTPALESLTIKHQHLSNTHGFTQLISLVQRSHCSIRLLHCHIASNLDSFLTLLEENSSLRDLSVRFYSDPDSSAINELALIEALNQTDDDTPRYCPNLQRLSIQCRNPVEMLDNYLRSNASRMDRLTWAADWSTRSILGVTCDAEAMG